MERIAKLGREVVELVAVLALAPLKMLVRRLLPGSTPMDEQRWAPAEPEPVVGDVTIVTAPEPEPAPARTNGVPPSPHASDLTAADAARLREAQREAESSPDGPGPELRVAPPWPGYDAMNVGQVLERLTGSDGTTRAMVRLYEETHKNRLGVLRATE